MFMDFSKLSVLIVEDVEPMQRLLIDVTSTLGVGKIYKAANGAQGYKKYILKQPDIIITDWHMPEVDGLEFMERVRKDRDSPRRNIPIIMISGLNAATRVTKARDLGVTEYLVKPFNAQDLAKRISHIINQPRDFIITEHFCGPDRRRNECEEFEGNHQRTKEPENIIKADTYLQQKVGKGQINPNIISRSETIMKKTEIDFAPMAKGFLDEFKSALNAADSLSANTATIKDAITFSVMQLKANAYTFKYDLVGELSNTTLEFLESTDELDSLILEILKAQHTTLTHLVNTNAKGDGGAAGKILQTELREAYRRYSKAKVLRDKDSFVIEVEKKRSGEK
jgi:CheY-like chemotaxis protein